MNLLAARLLLLFNVLALVGALVLSRPGVPTVRVPSWIWAAIATINIVLAVASLRGARAGGEEKRESQSPRWPVALGSLDARGEVSGLNYAAGAMFGLAEGARTSLAQLTHPEESAQNEALLGDMSAGRARDHVLERRCFRGGGEPFLTRWSLLFEDGGRGMQKAVVLFEDISELRDLEENARRGRESVRDLHAIVARENLEEQVGALLDLGRRRFEVETALLAQKSEDKMRLVEVRSADERLRRATSYSLQDAKIEGNLCRPKGPRGLLHAPFENSLEPVFLCQGETFLGAPVVVDGKIWGGLYFSDADGRESIEEEDREFLVVMASWLSGEMERRQARAELEKQQKELLEAAIQLENLAVRDGLTGAKNRRAFDEQHATEWQRARRYSTPLSLVLLDVDKFKSFNDTFGHPAGDEVLKKVAQVLADSIRNIDFLARYGGEEFVLLLPNTDANGAMIVAERLRQNIESALWTLRPVTASFGVATLSPGMPSPQSQLQAADEALYRSKEGGRNRVTHASHVVEDVTAKVDSEAAGVIK